MKVLKFGLTAFCLSLHFFTLWASCGLAAALPDAPVFYPAPNIDSPNNIIRCSYPSMIGWVHDETDKREWLKWAGPGTAPEPGAYNIATDYEKYTPKGITRRVGSPNLTC